jgi:hypothetical protein
MTIDPDAPYRPQVGQQPSRTRRYPAGRIDKLEDWMPNPPLPEMPALYDNAIVAAAKALSEGRAEPYQQRLMVDWWLNRACRLKDSTYIPGGADAARASQTLAGMQIPARQFVKLVQLRAENQSETEQGEP